jgi:hypothetical protein
VLLFKMSGGKVYSCLEYPYPHRNGIFTAYSMDARGRNGDPIIRVFQSIQGYVKQEPYLNYIPPARKKTRYLIVDGPFKKTTSGKYHNHFLCIPFRKIVNGESVLLNMLDGSDFCHLRERALDRDADVLFGNRTIENDYKWLLSLPREVIEKR